MYELIQYMAVCTLQFYNKHQKNNQPESSTSNNNTVRAGESGLQFFSSADDIIWLQSVAFALQYFINKSKET